MPIVERVYWDTPLVYCYHPETKEFTMELDCEPSPDGRYLKPDYCTVDSPLAKAEYQTNIFTSTGWTLVPDYRRTPLYNKTTKEVLLIKTLGTDCPSTHTPVAPPSSDSFVVWNNTFKKWAEDDSIKLDNSRNAQKIKIGESFIALFNEGFLSPTLNAMVDVRRDANHNDLQNYQSLYTFMVANNITTTMIKLTDNSMAGPITQSQLNILIIEIMGYGLGAYQRKWTLEAQIEACTTIEQVQAITW